MEVLEGVVIMVVVCGVIAVPVTVDVGDGIVGGCDAGNGVVGGDGCGNVRGAGCVDGDVAVGCVVVVWSCCK